MAGAVGGGATAGGADPVAENATTGSAPAVAERAVATIHDASERAVAPDPPIGPPSAAGSKACSAKPNTSANPRTRRGGRVRERQRGGKDQQPDTHPELDESDPDEGRQGADHRGQQHRPPAAPLIDGLWSRPEGSAHRVQETAERTHEHDRDERRAEQDDAGDEADPDDAQIGGLSLSGHESLERSFLDVLSGLDGDIEIRPPGRDERDLGPMDEGPAGRLVPRRSRATGTGADARGSRPPPARRERDPRRRPRAAGRWPGRPRSRPRAPLAPGARPGGTAAFRRRSGTGRAGRSRTTGCCRSSRARPVSLGHRDPCGSTESRHSIAAVRSWLQADRPRPRPQTIGTTSVANRSIARTSASGSVTLKFRARWVTPIAV